MYILLYWKKILIFYVFKIYLSQNFTWLKRFVFHTFFIFNWLFFLPPFVCVFVLSVVLNVLTYTIILLTKASLLIKFHVYYCYYFIFPCISYLKLDCCSLSCFFPIEHQFSKQRWSIKVPGDSLDRLSLIQSLFETLQLLFR